MKQNKRIIEVQKVPIAITQFGEEDFISLTDTANARKGDARAADIIKNWIRGRTTLEFLGVWE